MRDIAKIRNKQILKEIRIVANKVEHARNSAQIQELKKLNKYKSNFQIKLNDYRIGVVTRSDTVWFVRFGHRSLFYKKFP